MLKDNHKLTKNDLDIIKSWEEKKGIKCTSLVKKSLQLFSILVLLPLRLKLLVLPIGG